MPNQLPIPPELQHLVEKRERAERRKNSRRGSAPRRTCELGALGALEANSVANLVSLEERRAQQERRKAERRALNRRKRKSGRQ